MKREKFLWPLTAGHHEALMAAKEIQDSAERIRSDGAMGAWAALSNGAREFLKTRLVPHFSAEEKLVPYFVKHSAPGHPAAERMLADHRRLKLLLNKNSLDSMLLLAEGLQTHIQFEENELFPLLQETLTANDKKEALAELEKILSGFLSDSPKKEMNGGTLV